MLYSLDHKNPDKNGCKNLYFVFAREEEFWLAGFCVILTKTTVFSFLHNYFFSFYGQFCVEWWSAVTTTKKVDIEMRGTLGTACQRDAALKTEMGGGGRRRRKSSETKFIVIL